MNPEVIDVMVKGIPLFAVVMGLVQWFKTVKVPSAALPFISMSMGLILGVGYQISQTPLVSYGDWFAAVIYGLTLGLVASGIYDAGKSIVGKVFGNPQG